MSPAADPGPLRGARLLEGPPRYAFWLVRAATFVLICGLTLAGASGSGHRAFEIVVLGLIGVLGALWAVMDWSDRGRQLSAPWLPVTIGAIATSGGLGAALSPARSIVWFAVIAALAAGSDFSFFAACAVTAAGILGVEVGGLILGIATTTSVGLPLLLIVALLGGLAAREVRVRADQAAALVTQMRETQREQRRAAALDERNRIAREIHDVLAHSLSALGIQIGAARAVLDDTGDIAAANRLLEHAQHLADDGLSETQRAIHALRADTPPLPDSLTSLVADHQQHNARRVDLAVTGEPRPLRPDANLALIRTAREALTNAAKHAPAVPVTVTLDYGPEVTTLTVANPTPLGGTPRTLPSNDANGLGGGYGLAGMRERLLLIGGTLTAGSAAGHWTVQAHVPR